MNYAAKGDTYYGRTKLKDYNPALWSSVVSYFQNGSDGFYTIGWITPGPVTATGGFFSDMAALVLAPSGDLAAIGANQRGGYRDKLADNTVSTTTLPKWETRETGEGDFKQTFTDSTSSNPAFASEATIDADKQSDLDLIKTNAAIVNATQVQQAQQTQLANGEDPGNVASGYQNGVIADRSQNPMTEKVTVRGTCFMTR